MHVIPFKTKVFHPPHEDITSALMDVSGQLQERDILCIASKVVAIHENRCVPVGSVDKEVLVLQESDHYFKRLPFDAPLSIKNHTFTWAGGIDEANGDGYYILLPKDPTASACRFRSLLQQKTGFKEVGIIITDSLVLPFRVGVVGISIGHYGFHPTRNYVGSHDLFGRPYQFTATNIVDSLASAAVVVGGEGSEQTPFVIIRDVSDTVFTNKITQNESYIEPTNDAYRILLDNIPDMKNAGNITAQE